MNWSKPTRSCPGCWISPRRWLCVWTGQYLSGHTTLAKSADEDVEPPLAEAKALLEAFPHLARWVQAGWAGGGHGRYYRKDPKKFWPHQLEAKMAPIIQAAAKLNPEQKIALLKSWENGHDAHRDVKPLQTKAVKDYLAANPDLAKGKTSLLMLEKPWNNYTPEEATKLAPTLAQNRHPEAAYIRSIAAGGKEKNLEKMIDALLTTEAWRLGTGELRWSLCRPTLALCRPAR